MTEKKDRFFILSHSSNYDRLYQTITIAVTAASLGNEVYVVLFFDALRKFVEGEMDREDLSDDMGAEKKEVYKRMKTMNPMSMQEMIDTVKPLGNLKFIACSANVEFMGLEKEKVLEKVDEIMGLPTILKMMKEAKNQLYI
ncbi:MAG: hypothetical protein D6734_08740 [Candidatus Schekmanbacteria bacterium]|nr:MAG: hypothetical protein D6734_08740 [Candidatus Schekmanbacteria bacterium]